MIFFTDGQVFENRVPKESYIAVVTEDEKLISFLHVGYKHGHDAEGLAILQALRYIAKNGLTFSIIYTDSLGWAGIANESTKVRGVKPNKLYTKRLAQEVLELKKQYHVGIQWKSRKHNKAGKFLGSIWRYAKAYRVTLQMEETAWEDITWQEK